MACVSTWMGDRLSSTPAVGCGFHLLYSWSETVLGDVIKYIQKLGYLQKYGRYKGWQCKYGKSVLNLQKIKA